MKKFVALMLLGVFIASVAIGCGDKEDDTKKKDDKPAEKKDE